MKILYFANPSSPHDAKWINLIAKNHDVVIISQTDLSDTVYCDADITIHQILPQFQIFKHKRVNTLQKIDAIIESFKPDIIHSMYIIPNSFWACDSKKNIPHVITTRGSDILFEYPNNYIGIKSKKKVVINPIFNKKVQSVIAKATAITCTSSAQINVVSKFSNAKNLLIPTGIDFQSILDLKIKRKMTGTFEVFCPRYLKPLYNIEKIIFAFEMFQKTHPDSNLTLIDEKSNYADKMKAIVSSLNLNHKIKFIAKMDFKNLIATYYQSDLVIMIPESDGTPNTALEAMATETPLILGNANYDSSLFPNDLVWRLETNQPENLVKAMTEVKQMSPDDLKNKLGRACTHISAKANLIESISKLEKLYRSTI